MTSSCSGETVVWERKISDCVIDDQRYVTRSRWSIYLTAMNDEAEESLTGVIEARLE